MRLGVDVRCSAGVMGGRLLIAMTIKRTTGESAQVEIGVVQMFQCEVHILGNIGPASVVRGIGQGSDVSPAADGLGLLHGERRGERKKLGIGRNSHPFDRKDLGMPLMFIPRFYAIEN